MLNSKTSIPTKQEGSKLDVYMSWWGMNGIGEGGREWTKEEKVRQIAEAGFHGINGFIPEREETESWRMLLNEYGLAFSVNAYPSSVAELEVFLKNAKAYGDITFINAQVMTPFIIDDAAVSLLHDMHILSIDYEIPVFFETHRGTITQDLIRTAGYVQNFEYLPLTIDFSHFVLAGEMHSIPDEAERMLQTVLKHTASIHARVSNGEQIQIDVGEHGEHEMVIPFKRWWKSGMQYWLARAKDGESLPVVCELGPPSYAITFKDHDGLVQEISDRWKQSLLFKEMLSSIFLQLTQGE